ncbi:Holliday junction branch migration protein RuvA [Candidatus Mycoplasma pogonae]
MTVYKIGKISHVSNSYIILDCNQVGYLIYIPYNRSYQKDETRRIYIYDHINEYQHKLYGFNSFKERILFEDLLSISGIGPKTAISILEHDFQHLVHLIANGDVSELAKVKYITAKSAKQIVFSLSEKYQKLLNKDLVNKTELTTVVKSNNIINDLEKTLQFLGFKKKQIDFALNNVDLSNENIDFLVEAAIKVISNARELRT